MGREVPLRARSGHLSVQPRSPGQSTQATRLIVVGGRSLARVDLHRPPRIPARHPARPLPDTANAGPHRSPRRPGGIARDDADAQHCRRSGRPRRPDHATDRRAQARKRRIRGRWQAWTSSVSQLARLYLAPPDRATPAARRRNPLLVIGTSHLCLDTGRVLAGNAGCRWGNPRADGDDGLSLRAVAHALLAGPLSRAASTRHATRPPGHRPRTRVIRGLKLRTPWLHGTEELIRLDAAAKVLAASAVGKLPGLSRWPLPAACSRPLAGHRSGRKPTRPDAPRSGVHVLKNARMLVGRSRPPWIPRGDRPWRGGHPAPPGWSRTPPGDGLRPGAEPPRRPPTCGGRCVAHLRAAAVGAAGHDCPPTQYRCQPPPRRAACPRRGRRLVLLPPALGVQQNLPPALRGASHRPRAGSCRTTQFAAPVRPPAPTAAEQGWAGPARAYNGTCSNRCPAPRCRHCPDPDLNPDHRITGSPDHRITGSHHRHGAPPERIAKAGLGPPSPNLSYLI